MFVEILHPYFPLWKRKRWLMERRKPLICARNRITDTQKGVLLQSFSFVNWQEEKFRNIWYDGNFTAFLDIVVTVMTQSPRAFID